MTETAINSTKSAWPTLSIVTLLVCCGLAVGRDCSECHKLRLTGGDLSAWRGNTGDWTVVQDAALAPGNETLLAGQAGAGAILNGPQGKTVNLLTKQEFGDVRAHVEFMVSKDSNSGVYLMGRYEVQVFDSWQKPSAEDRTGRQCSLQGMGRSSATGGVSVDGEEPPSHHAL